MQRVLCVKCNPLFGLNHLKWDFIQPERPTGLWEGNHAGRTISRLVLSSEPATLLTTDCFYECYVSLKAFENLALLLVKFDVGTFCTCTVKLERTCQCASDLDLSCFKHIPPTIKLAQGCVVQKLPCCGWILVNMFMRVKVNFVMILLQRLSSWSPLTGRLVHVEIRLSCQVTETALKNSFFPT